MGSKPWYGSQRWIRARRFVLERDGHRCQLRCSRRCRGVANQVDHRVRPEDGGDIFNPANLFAACISCNIAKRNTQLAERAKMADARSW